MKDCPFLGVSVKKDERRCLGIKQCEFAAEFVNQEHQYVDFDSETFKNVISIQNNNSTQRKTYS